MNHDDAGPHFRTAVQHARNFGGVHAMGSNLDLVIRASDKLYLTVGEAPGEITRL